MGTTNAGLAEIAGLSGDTGSPTEFTYLALGTGTTAFSATQTALVSEISANGLARAEATASRITDTVANDTLQLTYKWTATGAQTFAEIGAFNASSGGDMAWRQVISPAKSLPSGSDYTLTIQITYADA